MKNSNTFNTIRVSRIPNEIEVLNENEVVAKIKVDWDKGTAIVEQQSQLLWDLPFRKLGNGTHHISTMNLLDFFEERCFPRTRTDKDKVLESLGLTVYSPLGIIKKTHGVLFDDYVWIRFKGEDLNYDDVGYR